MRKYWLIILTFILHFQRRRRGNRLRRYGFPLFLLAMSFFLKPSIYAQLGIEEPFLFLLFIVIVSAWYGGFGPGIMVTFIGGVINDYFYLTPKYTIIDLSHMGTTVVFFIEGICVSIVSEAYKQAEDQKNEFIGLAGHELKNPLTVIKGYSDLVQKYAKRINDPKLTVYTEKIQEHIQTTTVMIDDLLDITRIEAGQLSFHKETFSLYELVKDIVTDQALVVKTHPIYFSGKSRKNVYGDRHRIGQVIVNLITNAAKYSPDGKKILVRVLDEKEYVTVRVKDFGFGIPNTLQKKIFTRYFRIEEKLSRVQGLGIGLFISSQIVRQHNGLLGVKSKKGKGSTFYLKLPVVPKA